MVAPPRNLWGDMDGDGLKDLFVIHMEGNSLYRNLGDGTFEDVTDLSFPQGAGFGKTGFWGDFNKDGQLDLFLFHLTGFTLYRNEGKLRFSDVTVTVGLDPEYAADQAELFDFDGDGYPDLLARNQDGDEILHNRKGKLFVSVNLPQRNSRLGPPSGGPSAPGAPIPPA